MLEMDVKRVPRVTWVMQEAYCIISELRDSGRRGMEEMTRSTLDDGKLRCLGTSRRIWTSGRQFCMWLRHSGKN